MYSTPALKNIYRYERTMETEWNNLGNIVNWMEDSVRRAWVTASESLHVCR